MERILKFLIICTLFMGGPALAQRSDQDEARSATQSGDVLPYSQIRERVQRDHPGKVLDAELNRGNYKVRVLDDEGSVTDVTVNARTGEPVNVEGGGGSPRR